MWRELKLLLTHKFYDDAPPEFRPRPGAETTGDASSKRPCVPPRTTYTTAVGGLTGIALNSTTISCGSQRFFSYQTQDFLLEKPQCLFKPRNLHLK